VPQKYRVLLHGVFCRYEVLFIIHCSANGLRLLLPLLLFLSVFVVMAPPGITWSIEHKEYNCLAYLFLGGKIPEGIKPGRVREAHTCFAPWSTDSTYTNNWRSNFNRMKELNAVGRLKMNEALITDADKAELDGKIAEVLRKYAPAAGGGGRRAPPAAGGGGRRAPPAAGGGGDDEEADDDEYTEDDVEGVRKVFGGKCLWFCQCQKENCF
jgi:hypothetical protein